MWSRDCLSGSQVDGANWLTYPKAFTLLALEGNSFVFPWKAIMDKSGRDFSIQVEIWDFFFFQVEILYLMQKVFFRSRFFISSREFFFMSRFLFQVENFVFMSRFLTEVDNMYFFFFFSCPDFYLKSRIIHGESRNVTQDSLLVFPVKDENN